MKNYILQDSPTDIVFRRTIPRNYTPNVIMPHTNLKQTKDCRYVPSTRSLQVQSTIAKRGQWTC